MGLERERDDFGRRKRDQTDSALQNAAFRLCFGLDLDAVLAGTAQDRRGACMRIKRLLRRERLKAGASGAGHDVNRQIALRQALGRLGGDGTRRPRGPRLP